MTKAQMTEEMFEYAARAKFRFPSARGLITLEQLWDVPLLSKDDFNLDVIAKTVNKSLKAMTEESFVTVTADKARACEQRALEVSLNIVKHVIATLLDEAEALKARAENKVKREKLLKALAEKQDGKMSEMSEKELQRQIAALDD